jgi:hypothetical protein
MPDQRRITRKITRGWASHSDARENGAPQPRAMALHHRHATQTFDCISRTLEASPGTRVYKPQCLMKKNSIVRPTSKTITWTPNAFLIFLGHDTGFSTSVDYFLFLQEQIKDIIICGLQYGESVSGLDLLPRIPLQTLRDRRLRRPPPNLHATCRRHVGRT